jgi:hypothetical protein
MPDHNRHNSWNRPDDEPYLRLRPGRSDSHEDQEWDDLPDRNFRHDSGDRSLHQVDPPDGSVQPHESGFLGWDTTAWEDAGGFEAVLFGHLSNGLGHAGGFPPVIVFAIEDLDVNFNTLNQITQVQNTLVFLDASDGGTIDVGGDVNASGFQSAGVMNYQEFS